jgi:hypothetical protein
MGAEKFSDSQHTMEGFKNEKECEGSFIECADVCDHGFVGKLCGYIDQEFQE